MQICVRVCQNVRRRDDKKKMRRQKKEVRRVRKSQVAIKSIFGESPILLFICLSWLLKARPNPSILTPSLLPPQLVFFFHSIRLPSPPNPYLVLSFTGPHFLAAYFVICLCQRRSLSLFLCYFETSLTPVPALRRWVWWFALSSQSPTHEQTET